MGEIIRLKVTLMNSKPPVWREAEVASSATLAELHDILQVLMGWEGNHLWAFEFGKRRFELPDPDGLSLTDNPPNHPKDVTLDTLLAKKGAALRYNYDFGDDWWLKITVVAVASAERGGRYPRCLAGARAGPPEDCGGPPGYENLLAARKNPRSKHARELLDWAGADWDPTAFDLAVINKALAALPALRQLH